MSRVPEPAPTLSCGPPGELTSRTIDFSCGLSIGDYPPNFSYEVQKLAKRTLEDFRPLTERVRYLNQSARVKCSDVVCFP